MEPPSARELAFAAAGALLASGTCLAGASASSTASSADSSSTTSAVTSTTSANLVSGDSSSSSSSGGSSSSAAAGTAATAARAGSTSEVNTAARAAASKRKARRAAWKRHRKHRRLPLGEPQHSVDSAAAAVFEQIDTEDGAESTQRISIRSTVRRQVICREALAWLREQQVLEGHVIASLPDISEIDLEAWSREREQTRCGDSSGGSSGGGSGGSGGEGTKASDYQTVANYREWYHETVALILSRLAPHAVAIFYMSDGRHEGLWLDKSYIAQRAAEASGCALLFHKIALFDSDLVAMSRTQGKGRPKYSHLLAFSRTACAGERWFDAAATPDIFERGEMRWSRAMGDTACVTACLLVRAADAAATTASVTDTADAVRSSGAVGADVATRRNRPTVFSLFSGQGSVLAVANEMGMHSVGVELSRKRCATALGLRLLKASDAP
jgi:ribosomal protein L7/L12